MKVASAAVGIVALSILFAYWHINGPWVAGMFGVLGAILGWTIRDAARSRDTPPSIK